MTIDVAQVRAAFSALESGDGSTFFAHVADDVDWTVEGTHPLAGRYRSEADFQAGTFAKLANVLPQGPELRVAKRNGLRFDNKYCRVTRFADGKIVEVRTYLDSALVQRVLDENSM